LSIFFISILTFIRKTFYPDTVTIKNNVAFINYRYKGTKGTYIIPMGDHCKFDYEEFPITFHCDDDIHFIDNIFPIYPINNDTNSESQINYQVRDEIIYKHEDFKNCVNKIKEEELASLEDITNDIQTTNITEEKIKLTLGKITDLINNKSYDKEKMVFNLLSEMKNIL
jgi:hypothetical protein